ncbi:hypothetical protein ACFH04_13245 [Streptomyces noboritoensis]|uniref:Uncharacterized protein n=1 Tax=Streptomyces noboritoensis TaxID=67337 RepID=A0ABV6TJJ2_9ACTN
MVPSLKMSPIVAPAPLPAALHAARRAIPEAADSELVLDFGPESAQIVVTPAGPLSRAVLAAAEKQSAPASLAVVAHDRAFWHWFITPVDSWDEDPVHSFHFRHGTVILPPISRTGPPGDYWVRTPGACLVDPLVLAEALRHVARTWPACAHGGARLSAGEMRR